MEKNRDTKVIAIIALVVAVVGLSLGFAAFSQQLTIKPQADVKADESKFKVLFSNEQGSANTGDVTGVVAEEDDENSAGGTATITTDTLTNIDAVFSKEDQTITYTWWVRNDGEIDAYLSKVIFTNTKPTCQAKAEDTDDDLVQTACGNVTATVNVHGQSYTDTNESITGGDEIKLTAGTTTEIKLILKAGTGATKVDGDYTAKFDDIKVEYSSKKPSA